MIRLASTDSQLILSHQTDTATPSLPVRLWLDMCSSPSPSKYCFQGLCHLIMWSMFLLCKIMYNSSCIIWCHVIDYVLGHNQLCATCKPIFFYSVHIFKFLGVYEEYESACVHDNCFTKIIFLTSCTIYCIYAQPESDFCPYFCTRQTTGVVWKRKKITLCLLCFSIFLLSYL